MNFLFFSFTLLAVRAALFSCQCHTAPFLWPLYYHAYEQRHSARSRWCAEYKEGVRIRCAYSREFYSSQRFGWLSDVPMQYNPSDCHDCHSGLLLSASSFSFRMRGCFMWHVELPVCQAAKLEMVNVLVQQCMINTDHQTWQIAALASTDEKQCLTSK